MAEYFFDNSFKTNFLVAITSGEVSDNVGIYKIKLMCNIIQLTVLKTSQYSSYQREGGWGARKTKGHQIYGARRFAFGWWAHSAIYHVS